MRVLAARFSDREGAEAALTGLRSRLSMPDEDAAIAPLGVPGRGDEADATLLAGRFHENELELVRLTLTRAGGSLVADIDERWTRPRIEPNGKETARARLAG